MLNKKRSNLIHLVGVSLVLMSCSTHAENTVLNVAHDEAFPPFIYVENGKTVGLAAELLNAAAQRANITINYVPVPFADIQGSINTKADAIFPIAINAERAKTYDFSSPIVMTGGAFFVLKPHKTPFDEAELKGKKITTPKTGPLANYLMKNYPASTVLVTSNYDESLKQLVDKDVEVAALNLQVGSALAEQQYPSTIQLPDTLFLKLPLALAVNKNEHTALLTQLNRGLAKIEQDGSADEINAVWMSHSP